MNRPYFSSNLASGDGKVSPFDFNQRPFIVIWETTRACRLACRHCRAAAQNHRHPLELSTEEGYAFLDQVARAEPTVFIFTGGDPIRRPDLKPLIRYAADKGLRVGLSPSATPDFAKADLGELARLGVDRISLSLDGASRRTHDRFRGIKGTWDWTMVSIRAAAEAGLPVQINTTFTRQNIGEFDEFVRLLGELKPVLWSVFQLVPTGRGKTRDLLTGDELEALFVRLCELSKTSSFDIKTTEGHHYRRVVMQRRGAAAARTSRAPLGINDGKGFVFVSHLGEIYPSGFLPLSAGNVRTNELRDVYRNHVLFQQLRDPALLKGKCGRCEFNRICGGSRARAYALTGDYLAEEPLCVYQPGRTDGSMVELPEGGVVPIPAPIPANGFTQMTA